MAVIGLVSGSSATAFGLIAIAVLFSVVAKVAQEVSLMVADIADATIDFAAMASKAQPQPMPDGRVGANTIAIEASEKRATATNSTPGTLDSVQSCLAELEAIGCKVSKTGESSWEIAQPSGVKAYAHSPISLLTVATRILKGTDKPPGK